MQTVQEITAKCVQVTLRIEAQNFITENEAQFTNCLYPEEVREYVDYDTEVESCFGTVVILVKGTKRVGWWDAFSGLVFVAK